MIRPTLPTQRGFPGLTGENESPWFTRTILRPATAAGKSSGLTTLELCAGAGGQALGMELAGIEHVGLVEINKHACGTLRLNRPKWNVIEGDLNCFDGAPYAGVDLISGGLPCPPFSVAGKQLGSTDERNLFPATIRLVDQMRTAVGIANMPRF